MKKTEYEYKTFNEVIEWLKKLEYQSVEDGFDGESHKYAERRHKLEILAHINSKID